MTLVTYFSATGVTRKIAREISNNLNADIFEIIPKDRYTSEDLDWNDKNSRSSLEMKDSSSRPEILNKLGDIGKYDKVFIGFPVWWYTSPTIINTFIEENDLSGKDIYVFVTSGSSDSIESFNSLKEKYPNLNFVSSKRLNGVDDVKNWLQNS